MVSPHGQFTSKIDLLGLTSYFLGMANPLKRVSFKSIRGKKSSLFEMVSPHGQFTSEIGLLGLTSYFLVLRV